jgi:hypothetical protein
MIIMTIIFWPFQFLRQQIILFLNYLWSKIILFMPQILEFYNNLTSTSFYWNLINSGQFLEVIIQVVKIIYYVAAALESFFGCCVQAAKFFIIAIWPFMCYIFNFIYEAACKTLGWIRNLYLSIKIIKQKTRRLNNFTSKKKRVAHAFNSISILEKWFTDNIEAPYPSAEQKHQLAESTNLTITQINNWFMYRRRVLKQILKKQNN